MLIIYRNNKKENIQILLGINSSNHVDIFASINQLSCK